MKFFNKLLLEVFLLLFFDIVGFSLGVVFAYYTRILENNFVSVYFDHNLSYIISNFYWIFFIILISLFSRNLYLVKFPFWIESKKIVTSIFISFIIIFAIISLGKLSDSISRLYLINLWIYTTFFILLLRFYAKYLMYHFNFLKENIVVIGNFNKIIEFLSIKNNYLYEYNLKSLIILDKLNCNIYNKDNVNLINLKSKLESLNFHNVKLGYISDIHKIINSENILVAGILRDNKELNNITYEKHLSNIIGKVQLYVKKVIYITKMKEISLSNVHIVNNFEDNLNYLLINNNLKSLFNNVIKRSFDLIIAFLILPILLVMFIVIGILIKKDSKGPIFYKHSRIGRYGKIVNVYKFRTMYIDSQERLKNILNNNEEARIEWNKNFKLKNDPRITKFGSFLRKTSIDELPQIFNVIIGNMSFVGPRPVIKTEIVNYYKDYATYYFMVRPGITGLWQIGGRSDTDYETRINKDTWYVLNWSLWLDIVILFKTPIVVLKRKGAY